MTFLLAEEYVVDKTSRYTEYWLAFFLVIALVLFACFFIWYGKNVNPGPQKKDEKEE